MYLPLSLTLCGPEASAKGTRAILFKFQELPDIIYIFERTRYFFFNTDLLEGNKSRSRIKNLNYFHSSPFNKLSFTYEVGRRGWWFDSKNDSLNTTTLIAKLMTTAHYFPLCSTLLFCFPPSTNRYKT